ncbi:MAG: GNAT family N-acetyltransferase [Candidatus Zixiibacteriota bacterium]
MMIVQRMAASAVPTELQPRINSFSLYASIPFVSLWKTMSGTPVCWVLLEGTRIVAALPGVEFRPHPFTCFQAMVDGLYARIWVDESSSLNMTEAAGYISHALAMAGYARLYLTDFECEFPVSHGFQRQENETLVVDISNPDWEPPDATLRSEIRKAGREGVTVEPYDSGRHRKRFLELMTSTEHRHKRPPKYCDSFFDALALLAEQERRIRWVIGEVDGKLAASHIFLVDGASVLHWQVYFDKNFSFAKPNQYILYSMTRQLANEGVTRLNLGMSPPGAEGLAAYKEKWGALPYAYPTYVHRSWLGKLL